MQEMDDQIPKIELNASLETFGINHDLKLCVTTQSVKCDMI